MESSRGREEPLKDKETKATKGEWGSRKKGPEPVWLLPEN